MVSEIGAAEKQEAQRQKFLQEVRERYESSIIKTVYAVLEVRPAYNTGGYYDQDIPAYHTIVSPQYDTIEEAEEWMSRHQADEGKYLTIAKNRLRKIEFNQWTGWILEREKN